MPFIDARRLLGRVLGAVRAEVRAEVRARARFGVLAGVLVALAPGAGASTGACPERLRIVAADGVRLCLADFPIADETPLGHGRTLQRLAPHHGYFAVAATPTAAVCRRAVGLGVSPAGLPAPSALVNFTAARDAAALGDCERAASAADPVCACQLVASDGRSALTAAQLARYLGGKSAGVAGSADPPAQPSSMPAPTPMPMRVASPDARCEPRLRLTYADGSAGCLADHAVAERAAAGWPGTIRQLIPSTGLYNIAAAMPFEHCPPVIGYAQSQLLSSQAALTLHSSASERSALALRTCQETLVAARPAAGDCRCRLLVEDGISPLRRDDWSVASVRPAAAPAPAAPVRSETAAPAGGASELAALRQQIEALRADMARAAAAAPLPPPVVAAPPRKLLRARALVIGNGAYGSIGALPNPPRDAQAMAAKLRQFGIEVDVALDTTRAALVKALADFQERAAGADINILFYAGHGLQVGGINYIVPVDLPAAGATVGSIKLNTVSLNDALEYLPARTRIVFLDACRDNPLARSLMATRSAAGLGLAPVNAVSGTLVAYATKDGSTAEDGSGRNSPYTAALLEHLDAEEDIAVVLRRVRQAVLKATNQRQEPWEYGSLIGDQLVLSRLAR